MAHPNAATPEEMRALIAGRRTDDPTWFDYGGETIDPERICRILAPHITSRRRSEIESVLDGRTRSVAVAIDGMMDLGNVSAIMRTAEAFGIHAVHAIDTSSAFKRSRRTTRGADKWVDRYRWESPGACIGSLRSDGYEVLLADASLESPEVSSVDLTGTLALVFGNERDGVSSETRSLVAESVRVPTVGFVESLNVSVAASVLLHEVYRQRIDRFGQNGDLSPSDRDRIRAVWYLKSVKGSEAIVARHTMNESSVSR